jgi:hypothetical protein
MFEQLTFRLNYNNADFSDLVIPAGDREVLRGLAGEIAEIAQRPVMQIRRKLWTDHNALKPTRPLLLCDPENGWNEIIPDEDIQCSNSIARHWEGFLRKQVFWGNRMHDDYIVEARFDVPMVYHPRTWGVAGASRAATIQKYDEKGGAYHIECVLDDYAQLKDITKPELNIDYPTSAAVLDLAREILGDLLKVQQHTIWYWSVGMTDEYVFLRGMEKLLYDFYEEPDGIHQLMQILTDGMMERLDFLEAHDLFSLNNGMDYVGSGGIGCTDELPGPDFDGHVKTRHMWGHSESQVTLGVSPEMFAEFIFPYQKKLMERFGLTCYGCCEPMDKRIDIVKTVKNLRRVSCSPWADKRFMSEKLGRDYVYSLKVSPSPLAVPHMDEELVRAQLRQHLQDTRDNCVELLMKDNHTLGRNPRNLTRWVEIAREEIDSM